MRAPAILRTICQLTHDRRGTTAVVFVLSLPVFIGFAGLGVETGLWYLMQRQLQMAADLASYVGAVEYRSGSNKNEVQSKSVFEAEIHGFDSTSGTAVVNVPPQSGTHQNQRAVEVLLSQPIERVFSQLFNTSPLILNVRAVSAFDQEGTACILALDTWASDAVIFIGNPTATFSDCNIMSNSLADDSITIAGSADVTVPCVISAGGTSVSAELTLTECTAPLEYMPQAADPFDDLPEPPIPGSCSSVPGGDPGELKTLDPGKYCGGLSLSGDFQLNPGIYVISGGEFRINGNSNVEGSGVVFFLTDGATVHFNGTATLSLSAPTTGTYAGVLMYGDRHQGGATNIFNGTANSSMTGALYFPSQKVQHNGDFSGQNGCLRIVARAIDLQGNADFATNCGGTGIDDIMIPGAVRLAE